MGNMSFIAKAIARYTGGSDSGISISIDKQRNILVAQGNPAYTETRRRGEGWTVFTSTPMAAVVDLPTTDAALELYNNGSRVAVVSDIHLFRLLGTAVAVGECIFVCITTQKVKPTLTAQVLYSMNGKPLVTPTATSELVTGIDTTIIANGWAPYGPGAAYLAAATPGTGFNVKIDGKLQIPPGCSLALIPGASVTTASAFYVGVTFDWVTMTQEA